MIVSRSDLERSLERIRTRVPDPQAGIFGPRSKSWQLNREAIVFLGGGRAALLQTAHPYVAHAIEQHSRTRTDLAGRFRRTFENVFAMAFGDLDAAFHSARRVHAIHERVRGILPEDVGAFRRGAPYAANDEEALLWVHATLCETSVHVFERVVRPLRAEEKRAFYEESRLFAYLFGISDAVLPATWDDFIAYNRGMWESDTLAVGRAAREIGEFLFKPARPALAPLASWYRVMTAGLLPERIRRGYGLPFGSLERATFGASMRLLQGGYPLLPTRVRYLPAYVNALRRLSGKSGKDRIGEAMNRAVLAILGRPRGRRPAPEPA